MSHSMKPIKKLADYPGLPVSTSYLRKLRSEGIEAVGFTTERGTTADFSVRELLSKSI